MRKSLILFAATLITGSLFAGGIVTNTNQSAAWVRQPARNASVGIDAVYYNPAGLMKLENGFHFSLSNQTIFQTKDVENFYKGPSDAFGLNEGLYTGKISAPVFPTIQAAYKMDKLAFSFGFGPVGGGGGATYKKGLPSFEMSQSDLVPLLASQGAQGYRLDAYLKGSSVFYGFQGGVSYKINDWISVAAGLRYVAAKNTYLGHLKDIEVDMAGTWTRADAIMNGISAQLTGITTIPTQLQPLTSNPATQGLTLTQLVGAGLVPAATKTSIEGALAAIGVPAANIPVMTVTQISGTVTAASPTLIAQAAKYTATATLLGDQEVDVEQTGSGISPFFSVNLSPSEKLNIGIKYEMVTKMELTNKTAKDLLVGFTTIGEQITMFKDGAKTPSDMPAMLSIGIDYKVASKVKLSLGSNYYFDKSADYGHKLDLDLNSSTPSTFVKNKEIIDDNGWSLQAGLEVNLSEKLLVSGGYILANQGVNSKYQSDLTYFLGTHTFGVGGAYSVTDKIQINLGAGYTIYIDDEKMVDHMFASPTPVNIPARETYAKKTMMFGVGVDFRF
jgi:long-subunit fatty acid transport protein